jgi:hypothetical protein
MPTQSRAGSRKKCGRILTVPSELHETIIDDIRFSFSLFMRTFGYELHDNVGFLAEASAANILTGLTGIGLVADGYIFSNDGYGVIPVEVGSMRSGKWSAVMTTDDKPIRVLRVDFDLTIWVLRPRNTSFEKQLLQFYGEQLNKPFMEEPKDH